MVNVHACIAVSLDQTGRLSRSGRQGVFLGLRFAVRRACQPEVCLIKGCSVNGEGFIRLCVRLTSVLLCTLTSC